MSRKREMQWLSETYVEARVSPAEYRKRALLRVEIGALKAPYFDDLTPAEREAIRERVRAGISRQSVWPSNGSGHKRGKN